MPFVLFVTALREAVSYDVFRWRGFENGLSVGFKPGMAVEHAAGFVSHTKYDPRWDAVA